MGSFDRRNSRKMLQRRAQAAKKLREHRRAETVRASRVTASPTKKRSSKSSS